MNSYEIGGFIEFPTSQLQLYHKNAIATNSGANALRYIIRCLCIRELAIPRYICSVVHEIASEENCIIIPYSIGEDFYPIESIPQNIPIIYVNYWGIHGSQCAQMAKNHTKLILDCSQAFFTSAIGWASFYSPRKFFGVPDGGYAMLPEGSPLIPLKKDTSYAYCQHLLQRADGQRKLSYEFFKKNETRIRNLPLRAMSNLTERILSTVAYAQSAKIRRENFLYLHTRLSSFNLLKITLPFEDVPLAYPFMTYQDSIYSTLLKYKIFIPRYWPNLSHSLLNSFEYDLANHVLALPIDQRYGLREMQFISDTLMYIINK